MDFVLDRMPRAKYHIFVDASTSWGVGGCCGRHYFPYSWLEFWKWSICVDSIARMELFSALISILCFGDKICGRLIELYIDNENAYAWLRKSRCTNTLGTKFLAKWEYRKWVMECKVSVKWIPSEVNVAADALSRGRVPPFLKRNGTRVRLTRSDIKFLTADPVKTWLSALN